MGNRADQERLSKLISLLCDGLIIDEQFAELDAMLSSDADARRRYHVYLGIHQSWAIAMLKSTPVRPRRVQPRFCELSDMRLENGAIANCIG